MRVCGVDVDVSQALWAIGSILWVVGGVWIGWLIGEHIAKRARR